MYPKPRFNLLISTCEQFGMLWISIDQCTNKTEITFLPPAYFDCFDNLQLYRVQDFTDLLNWLLNFFMYTQKVNKSSFW